MARPDRRRGSVTEFLDALTRLATRSFWLVVALVVLILVANAALVQFRERPLPERRTIEHTAPPPIPWEKVDHEVALALLDARKAAREAVQPDIDEWVAEMKLLADEAFLDWYFDYWNGQMLDMKHIWYWSLDRLFEEQPTAAERITGDIQEEFANQVLRPRLSNLRLERITEDAVEVYVQVLSDRIGAIPGKYRIPGADWDRYLEDIAVMSSQVEGTRRVDLKMKAIVVGGGVAAVVTATKLRSVVRGIGSRLGGRFAGAAGGASAGAVASRTGTKVGTKTGGKMLGPIVGVGIVVWDVWDHHQTKKVNRPILKRAIDDYLDELGRQMLDGSDTGVLGAIYHIENNVVRSLAEMKHTP